MPAEAAGAAGAAPGTLVGAVAAAVLALTRRHGRGAGGRELDAECATRTGTPCANLRVALVALRRAGIVRRGGLFPNRPRYVHRDHPVPFHAPGEPAAVIAAYIGDAWARHGAPVSTRQIGAALRAAGCALRLGAPLQDLLEGMSAAPRYNQRYTADDARELPPDGVLLPTIRRVDGPSALGRHRVFWAPAAAGGAALPEADASALAGPARAGRPPQLAPDLVGGVFPTRAAALRNVIGRLSAALEMPVTLRQLRWWCVAHSDDPAAAALLAPPGRDLNRTGVSGQPGLSDVASSFGGSADDASVPDHGPDPSRAAPVALAEVLMTVLRPPRVGSSVSTSPQTDIVLHVGGFRDGLSVARVHAGRTYGPADSGRVRQVVTPLSTAGGCPRRVWAGALTRWAAGAVLLDDVVRAFRPTDEHAGVEALRRSPPPGGRARRDGGLNVYGALADARVRAFAGVLARYGLDAETVQEARGLARRAYGLFEGWIPAAPTRDQRYSWQTEIRRSMHGYDAALALLHDPAVAGTAPAAGTRDAASEGSLRVAGDVGLITLTALVPLYAHLLAALGALPRSTRDRGSAAPWRPDGVARRDPDRERFLGWPLRAQRLALNVVIGARRFPAPEPGRRAGAAGGMSEPHLDRVDAILGIFDAKPFARATTLLTGARRVLGHVLRDPAALGTLLADPGRGADPAFRPVRRALVVGLGLLGEAPPPEEFADAMHGPDAVTTAEAYALSVVLAHLGAREPTLATLDRAVAAHPGLCAVGVLDKARRRVETGAVLTVVG